MTPARHDRKHRAAPVVVALIFGIGQAVATEFVVVDRHTGIAISGFDPVAYFTDRAAREGTEGIEASFAGVAWRFRNEGNRAAFVRHPGVYMPQFGGYDPVGLARSAPVPGDPRFFVMLENKVYLFASDEARILFERAPELYLTQAVRQWPVVRRTLAP